MRVRLPHLWLCCLASLLAVACGDSAPSLTPTALPSGSSGSGGAVIVGQVNGGSGLARTTSGATAPAVTVTVVGTGVTATVDGLGRFTLTNVPAGNIELKFTGPGIDAVITITNVGPQDQIQIAVTVNGNTAVLQAHQKVSKGKGEIEGRITSMDLALRTMQVSGTQVSVPPTASIRRGSHVLQFQDLQIGHKVEVYGTLEGTVVQATEIKVKGESNGLLNKIEGVVAGLSGTCPSLTFTVNGNALTTSGATYFKHGACATLQNGMRVEVRAERQADGSLVAVQVAIAEREDEDDEDDEDEEDEVKLEGAVSGLTGTCPVLSFTVGEKTVSTTSSTKFEGGACTTVVNGTKVEVKGTKQADGSVVAAKVKRQD